MQYGETCQGVCDYNYYRFQLWSEDNACIQQLYSPTTVNLISQKVSELTKGVDHLNRKIIVPYDTICQVIDGIYQVYRPPRGDIHTRYHIPNMEQDNVVQSIIDQTIELIVTNIRNEYDINKNNEKLSAWVQVLGDFNTNGLRSHDVLKIKERRANTMQFNMNY